MKASTAKQFQSEALQYANSLSALLSEASALVQKGRADEALGLYHTGQRDLQAFQDKWDAEIRSSDDPPFVDWWQQYMPEQKASLLTNEGLALHWMGKLEEASALFDNALLLTPAESANHAFLLDTIGSIRHNQQAFAEAEALCRRAYAEYAALAANAAKADPDSAPQFFSDAALCLASSAYSALQRGDHAGFNKSFDEAIGFAEQHNLPDLADKLWLRQARGLLQGDASGETIQRVDEERERRSSRSNDPNFKSEALQLIAACLTECGVPKLARKKLEQARQYTPPQRQWALLRKLADISETLGDTQAAHRYSQEALASARQLGMPQPVAAALRALVLLHAENNPDEAEQYLSELRTFGEMEEIKTSLLGRALVYCQQKRFELALQDVDEAERALPEDPNVLLARVVVLRNMGAKEEALALVEKAAAALRKQIRQSGTDLKSGLDSLGALHESAAFLTAELGRTEEAFVWAEHGKALRLRSRFIVPTDAPKPAEIAFSDLRERLRAESARLLFFCVRQRGTLALLCDPDFEQPRAFFIDLTEEALAKLLPSRLQSSGLWNAAVFDALPSLSEKLAPCLSEATRGKESGKLYIVPDSQLYFVPFPALDIDGGSKVIDHCAVIYLPCAAMLVTGPQAQIGLRTCLAIGTGGEHDFSFSEQAAQIAALGWDTSECLRDARAQDFLCKAAQFNVLHLQCHGHMEGSLQGTRSASILQLADQTIVSAKDIYNLSLNAELVFLNACVSGRFQTRLASDVGGFWEAFLHAGASGVIVTLAYVHPESAQRLALAFYRHWLNGKDSSEALRQAQLEVRRERPEPCHWATHILIG
jgi:tetratricopeptide (TPR) repeat protein